jgi:thymidylate kinase
MNKKTLLERKNKRGALNKFDKKYLGEFARIQKNYNEISKIKIGKRNFYYNDASQSKELIHNKLLENLKKWKLIK